jgi:peptidase S41-like protein
LKQFFDGVRARKIGRIAVDVRRNGGGDSRVVNELLRYVDIEHYTGCGAVVRWSDDARARLTGVAKLAGLLEHYPQMRVANARVPEPFRGQLFVLTSKATFSSGNWFALFVQDNKIGKVLGEPTGNAPSSYGDTLRFGLQHSGLSYTLSYKHWQRPDPKRDPANCLTPDVLLVTTRRHVLEGTDPVLEHLRKMR